METGSLQVEQPDKKPLLTIRDDGICPQDSFQRQSLNLSSLSDWNVQERVIREAEGIQNNDREGGLKETQRARNIWNDTQPP